MTEAAIWGAGGFAGSALSACAEASGWTVRRLDRLVLPMDSEVSAMAEMLRGAGIAFHCAGKIGQEGHEGYGESAMRFARACAEAGVQRLVYLSTVAVYGPQRRGFVSAEHALLGADAYAASRIEAERAIQAALSGGDCAWTIVRVPMLVGSGMPGRALRRLAGWARYGLFPHPGPEDAVLACLGIRRLAALLVRSLASGNALIQFADHVRWLDVARRAGELYGRRVVRLPLPPIPGRLGALASTAHYQDDSARFGGAGPLPETAPDLDDALRP